jgi:hypothetical protein
MFANHDKMRQGPNPFGEPLGNAIGTIRASHAAALDQAGTAGFQLFEHDCQVVTGLFGSGSQPSTSERAGSNPRTKKQSVAPGTAGNKSPTAIACNSGRMRSALRQPLLSMKSYAVPTRPTRAHLDEPRPDVARWPPNRDRMRERGNRRSDQLVSGKGAGAFTTTRTYGPARRKTLSE